MKHIQKLILAAFILALFIPYVGHAASSNVSSCTPITNEAFKKYDRSIKTAEENFATEIKYAEKVYKDAIKDGQNKEYTFHVLREATWESFKKRRLAIQYARSDFGLVEWGEYRSCLQGLSPQPTEAQYYKPCAKMLAKAYGNELKEYSKLIKLIKKTHPTSAEVSDFTTQIKSLAVVAKDIKDTPREICGNLYPQIFVGTPTTTPESSTADSKRLSDIRQLAATMEIYYNDFNRYPTVLSTLVPNYIASIPMPPNSTNSKCSSSKNKYTYSYISETKYKLTFCFEKSTSGYSAGDHTLSEAGII